jgi:hypothetical protein
MAKTLHIPRAPKQIDVPTRRALDVLSDCLNALIDSGLLTQTGPGTWNTSAVITGIGPPPAALGVVGSIYLDVTDPYRPLLYHKR